MTAVERKTLFRFLSLYLGSLFVLFAVIAYLFYIVEYRFYYDKTKHKMQMYASTLSAKIIHAHMGDMPLFLEKEILHDQFEIGFYDASQKPLATKIEKEIDFSKIFYEEDRHLILVDKSAFGHLDVTYTVIEERDFFETIAKIKKQIIITLLLLYILITVIGYYLAKLFIKPIQMKRLQLDNFIKESTHELNTPISALLMSIKPSKEMDQKSLERIQISAKRISDIYKDLTYLFLKNQESDQHTAKEMLIDEILKTQIAHLTPLAEKKKITIIEHYHKDIYFTIDEESLIRLVSNLLSNAIKYNRIGGKIEITTKADTLIIKDNGIGIDKRHQKEIYKRFYRGTNESGGFGLGLNIVYKICQTYGIGIEMDSKLRKGTVFVLKFQKTTDVKKS